MTKKLALLFILLAVLSLPAFGQVTVSVANAGTTGTTVNTLTKFTGAPSTAVIAATSDTANIVGITIAGAGTTGNAIIAKVGLASCVFDGATTAGDYVQISSSTAGNCHDTGSGTYPTSGGQVIGRVTSTNGAGGTFTLDMGGGTQASSTGTVTTSGSPASPNIAAFSGTTAITTATGHQIQVPHNCADSSGSGTAQSCTTSPTFTPASPDCVTYTTTTTNSGTGLTVNVNSLGTTSVAIPGSSGWTTTLTAGIIPANKPLLACYDGTNWNVQQTGTAAASGGGGSGIPYAIDTGAVNAYVVTLSPAMASYTAGTSQACFIPTHSNTSTTPTVNFNGLGAKTITRFSGITVATTVPDIQVNEPTCVIYDGTNFQLLNPLSHTGTQSFVLSAQPVFASNITIGDVITAVGSTNPVINPAHPILMGGACKVTSAVTLSTASTTICSFALPNSAQTWAWQCSGTYSITAGTTPDFGLGMNASQTPTSETGNALISSVGESTSATQIFQGDSNTATASGNQSIFTSTATLTTVSSAPWTSSGTIQASATAGTFAITGILTGTTPAGTVNVGSTCQLY